MTRIVATYAAAGEGHRRASEAVVAAAQSLMATVELRDCLEGSAPWFRQTYTQGYLALVRNAPTLWGGLYGLTDLVGGSRCVRFLRRWGNVRQGRSLAQWLTDHRPAAVIATHFFPVEVVAALKRSGALHTRLVSVITDWLPHSFWLAPEVDQYAVASEATRRALITRGVDAARITVTGIPIDERFATPLDRQSTAARLGLDPSRFTVLIGSGGFGLGPVEGLVKVFARVPQPCQLLVVAGRHERLRLSVEALRPAIPHPMMVYGFIHNMDELMAVSDVLISKPGGLTCAEAMARRVPLVAVSPIPGQESRNSEVLVQEGAAVRLSRMAELPSWVARLHDPTWYAKMAHAAERLGKPHAARDVLRLALELAHG